MSQQDFIKKSKKSSFDLNDFIIKQNIINEKDKMTENDLLNIELIFFQIEQFYINNKIFSFLFEIFFNFLKFLNNFNNLN